MDTDDRRWLDAHGRADGDEDALLAANIQFNELAAAYGPTTARPRARLGAWAHSAEPGRGGTTGEPAAMVALGDMYLQGVHGYERDLDVARALYERAAELDHPEAHGAFGVFPCAPALPAGRG